MSQTMEPNQLKQTIIAALRTIHDPEIPVNLYDLGLIYSIDIEPDGAVRIRMTLTTPNCPVAETMPVQVKDTAAAVEGVRDVTVDLVWEPQWTAELMSEDAKMQLEMMASMFEGPAWIGLMASTGIAWLVYLLWLRKYFRSAG